MRKNTIQLITLALVFINFISCKKAIDKDIQQNQETNSINKSKQMRLASNTIQNPYSLKTIRTVLEKYANDPEKDNCNINENEYLVYVTIAPESLSPEAQTLISNDDNIRLYEIPLDNKKLYQENLTDVELEELKDGNLYGVVSINSNLLSTSDFAIIDTLYQPHEDQDWLEEKVLWETGLLQEALKNEGLEITPELNNKKSLKLFSTKKPEGYVKYQDTELGSQPVINVEVDAIFMGLPLITHTNSAGYFKINHGFLLGTVILTRFKNLNVNIKPVSLSAAGGGLNAFILGAVSYHGWYSKNSLPNINIGYNTPGTAPNLWSHIINNVYYHKTYCGTENIYPAPPNLVCYAVYSNNGIGSASTPMFGHINPTTPLTDQFLSNVFGGSLITQFANVYNSMVAIAPDLIIQSGSSVVTNHSCLLSQTILHELSHASMYVKVGNAYWTQVAKRETDPTIQGQGYGNGNQLTYGAHGLVGIDSYVQQAESWAEFLGQNYALRRYLNGSIKSQEFSTTAQPYVLLSVLEDNEHYFFNDWIQKGVYNDLMDANSPFELLDNVSGLTIKDMYDCFAPSGSIGWNNYLWTIRQNHPTITATQTNDILTTNN